MRRGRPLRRRARFQSLEQRRWREVQLGPESVEAFTVALARQRRSVGHILLLLLRLEVPNGRFEALFGDVDVFVFLEVLEQRLREQLVGDDLIFTGLAALLEDLAEEPHRGVVGRVEVKDVNVALLSVAIEATVALLHFPGVPRDVPVEHEATRALEVQAFTRCVGGEQHARGAVRVVERALHAVALDIVHAAVQDAQPLAVAEAGDEARAQVVERGEVLGEDDEALVLLLVDERFERLESRVGLDLRGRRADCALAICFGKPWSDRFETERLHCAGDLGQLALDCVLEVLEPRAAGATGLTLTAIALGVVVGVVLHDAAHLGHGAERAERRVLRLQSFEKREPALAEGPRP